MEQGLGFVTKLPIDPSVAKACDLGQIENINTDWTENLLKEINKER